MKKLNLKKPPLIRLEHRLERRGTFTVSPAKQAKPPSKPKRSPFSKFHDILTRSSPDRRAKLRTITEASARPKKPTINANCNFDLKCFVNFSLLCTGVSFSGLRVSRGKLISSRISYVIGALSALVLLASAAYFFYNQVESLLNIKQITLAAAADGLQLAAGLAAHVSMFLCAGKLVLLVARYSSLNASRKQTNTIVMVGLATHVALIAASVIAIAFTAMGRGLDADVQGLLRQAATSYSRAISRTLILLIVIEACNFAHINSKLASDIKLISSRSILSSARLFFAKFATEHSRIAGQLSVAITLELFAAAANIIHAIVSMHALSPLRMALQIMSAADGAIRLATFLTASRALHQSAEKLASSVARIDVQCLDSGAQQELMLFATIGAQCARKFSVSAMLVFGANLVCPAILLVIVGKLLSSPPPS